MEQVRVVHGQRGNILLIFEGYKYKKHRIMNGGGVRWRCYKTSCTASLKTAGSDDYRITENKMNHNHEPLTEQDYQRQMLSAEAKRKAEELPMERPAKILDSLMTGQNADTLKNSDLLKIKRNMYDARRKIEKSSILLMMNQFSTMDVATLIQKVKEREPLWDRKHVYYHDRTVTMSLWEDVAYSLDVDWSIDGVKEEQPSIQGTVDSPAKPIINTNGLSQAVQPSCYIPRDGTASPCPSASNDTAETARAKWKGLRDTFRGELRKLHKTMIAGKPRTSTNWEYFDKMLFVKDQIYSYQRHHEEIKKRRKLLESRSQSCTTDDSNEGDLESNTTNNLDNVASSSGSLPEEITIKPVIKIEPFDPLDEYVEPETVESCPSETPMPSTSSTGKVNPEPRKSSLEKTIEDDDFNFLMSLLPQLKCLPTTRNLFVRLKIQELLYNEIVTAVQPKS